MSPSRPEDPAAATPALHAALDQSEKVTVKVEEAAHELAAVNTTLQKDITAGAPTAQVQRTIEKSEAVEQKVQEAAAELVEVTTALAAEVDEREAIEGHVLEMQSDLLRSQSAEAASRHRALHDALTNLPNATLFADRLELALEQARRHEWRLAVMFLDLDRFKHINDTHGHDIGDRVLQETAERLTAFVRGGDSVGRRGGDEFLVLILEVQDDRSVHEFGMALAARIEKSMRVSGVRLSICASIGIAVFPDDGATGALLLERADLAMYVAKKARCIVSRYQGDDPAELTP
ncbi:MAG: GGDEF domain-containing protein [Gemmatimonadales bacterium]|nr:GGDEF domain-containing protein [Gemmatimonadales bacterium]